MPFDAGELLGSLFPGRPACWTGRRSRISSPFSVGGAFLGPSCDVPAPPLCVELHRKRLTFFRSRPPDFPGKTAKTAAMPASLPPGDVSAGRWRRT